MKKTTDEGRPTQTRRSMRGLVAGRSNMSEADLDEVRSELWRRTAREQSEVKTPSPGTRWLLRGGYSTLEDITSRYTEAWEIGLAEKSYEFGFHDGFRAEEAGDWLGASVPFGFKENKLAYAAGYNAGLHEAYRATRS